MAPKKTTSISKRVVRDSEGEDDRSKSESDTLLTPTPKTKKGAKPKKKPVKRAKKTKDTNNESASPDEDVNEDDEEIIGRKRKVNDKETKYEDTRKETPE